jgi:hypothetical protein
VRLKEANMNGQRSTAELIAMRKANDSLIASVNLMLKALDDNIKRKFPQTPSESEPEKPTTSGNTPPEPLPQKE